MSVMYCRRKLYLLLVFTFIVSFIISGIFLYYYKVILLENCAVEVNGNTYSSSQPLAESLGIWEHEIERISLSGNIKVAAFSEKNGFALLTTSQEPLDVVGIKQVFLLKDDDTISGRIKFNCSDGSSYSVRIIGNKFIIAVKNMEEN